jgi:thiol-disulfide isomerase/thioredoxin
VATSVMGRSILPALAVLASICLYGAAAEPAQTTAGGAYSLYFANGDTVIGHLLDSKHANTIAWESGAFRAPLNFPVATVQSIQFKRAIDPNLVGPYCFELAGGDALYGSLAGLDEREAVISTTGLGKLHVDRTSLVRFFRTSSTDLVFSGPGGLDGWDATGPAKGWHDEGGQLRTDQPDATLRRTFSVPPLVRYELELSWSSAPNFELTVGLDKNRPTIRPAFRVEVWGEDLVITRESERAADFCSLQKVAPGPGQIHFQVLFDQKQGRLIVLSATGEKQAEITIPDNKTPAAAVGKGKPTLFKLPAVASAPPGGVQLVNRRGDIKLQRLTISCWSGTTPESPAAGKAWLQQTDGAERFAELRSYDPEKRQFILREADADQRLDEKDLQHIVLSRSDSAEPRSVRLLLTTGERVSGDLVAIQQEKITVQCPGVRELLVFPLDQLHSLFVLKQQIPKLGENTPAGAPPEGRLELDGISLHGRLTAVETGDSPSLVFQPRYAQTDSPLVPDISARLIFREPPPEQPKQQSAQSPRQAGLQPVRVLNGVRTLLGARYSPAARPAAPGDCLLHLRSGDTISCRVERTDEQGVWLKSTQTSATFVPHAKIKALELRQDVPQVKIDKTKADRLLTLPRMQRDNPPEQLIRSLEGDYLRGRLLAMDEQELQVELRLETRTIKRAQVARIIWLQPDETAGANSAESASDDSGATTPPTGVRVQAVPRDGRRLTYFAQKLEGQILHGQSEVLGACRIGLDTVDQLLIGPAIDKSAATLVFHQWKLRPAPEPLPTPEEGADPGASEGLESVLVGKPAPPIELDFLDGKKFRLENYKNKVLVIDFWASWCGPCLQTMPQVEKVAAEFAEQGVKLVAINLEESPERVRATLERLKLDITVALDREGRVAERYGATSIPQTVVIDREGKVARLFVGGSPRFDGTLRQALKAVLDPPNSKTE